MGTPSKIMLLPKELQTQHLIIPIRRPTAEEQPRKGELPGGAVSIYQLFGNVQEDVVALLVRVVQRAVRHQEEVLRGQVKRVCGNSRDIRAVLLELYGGGNRTVGAVTHAIHMYILSIFQDTTWTFASIVAYLGRYQVARSCFRGTENWNQGVFQTARLGFRSLAPCENNE